MTMGGTDDATIDRKNSPMKKLSKAYICLLVSEREIYLPMAEAGSSN
jgi:hypothetical protein